MKISTAIAAALSTLLIGFSLGIYVETQHDTAALVKTQSEALKQVAQDVPAAIEKSNKIEAAIDRSNEQVQTIKKEVKTRIQKQKERVDEEYAARSKIEPVGESCLPFSLDVGTVRLLNAARKGTSVDTAGFSDEALAAPSNIGIDKLLENDLEIVRLYRDLAKRHDELVDAVEKMLKRQAE